MKDGSRRFLQEGQQHILRHTSRACIYAPAADWGVIEQLYKISLDMVQTSSNESMRERNGEAMGVKARYIYGGREGG